ncbi:carboxypeptidase-like regulatory domain-containing protein [Salegentibacter sp. JZCK2]|uniref:carboxypeptidase-like regulatory domain-containing protein n=1 Tax=Salegentibacter tibetensis TaxID=2873600 RepID=UPI001CCFA5B7|nr:carboxypeptidase-like regulatory domain-containing protein [Salegentibacter tibetensis]MBZ9728792.1 carboxypeptidase-like regulatory domain-containing protein [Salegentibacter tibetensis]
MQKIFTLILICFLSQQIKAQKNVEGYILNIDDSTAIAAASVYFDGTSIGVSTNSKGFFSIKVPEHINSPLIISSLGFQVKAIADLSEITKENPIFLIEKPEALDAVLLEADPWTRKKKLAEFRREFFGPTPVASSLRIENEDILKLRYSPSQKTLIANASEPLKVVNRYLGYTITYNLSSFKVTYQKSDSGLIIPYMIYYEGFGFFKETKTKTKKRYIRRRKKSFEGSLLHFMRALSNQTLAEEGFRIFKKSSEVRPYEYFELTQKDNLVLVKVLAEKLNILYNNTEQSGLLASGKFSIDQFGNHDPPQNLVLSGSMGNKRLAYLLPTDFNEND